MHCGTCCQRDFTLWAHDGFRPRRWSMKEERILGIDFGTKRMGIAISDPTGTIASPLKTVATSVIEEELTGLMEQYTIGTIIIGHPLRTDGKSGDRAAEVEDFARALEKRFTMPVILFDERFSTQAAERAMRDMDEKPSRNKAKVDRIAAALVLQSYLDSRNQ